MTETVSEPTHASRPAENPGVVAPPPLLYLGALAAGFALQALMPDTHIAAAVRWPLGALLCVAGAALARSFFREFARASTPVSPYSKPTALVTRGPYRLTRNPGYVGMTFACAGIAVLASSLWVLVPVAIAVAIIDRGVVAREERFLERAFGDDYLRYKARVRRWL
jgi:protein-S-isoprenylcysteine O-methyltransferase Ste14